MKNTKLKSLDETKVKRWVVLWILELTEKINSTPLIEQEKMKQSIKIVEIWRQGPDKGLNKVLRKKKSIPTRREAMSRIDVFWIARELSRDVLAVKNLMKVWEVKKQGRMRMKYKEL